MNSKLGCASSECSVESLKLNAAVFTPFVFPYCRELELSLVFGPVEGKSLHIPEPECSTVVMVPPPPCNTNPGLLVPPYI